MPEKQQVQTLLKHIQDGLKLLDLEELNNTLSVALEPKFSIVENSKVENLLCFVCAEFKITKSELINCKKRTLDLFQAKTISYCLLNTELKMPIRKISKKVFNSKSHTSVVNALNYYKNLNLNIPNDKKFLEKYNAIKLKLNNKR